MKDSPRSRMKFIVPAKLTRPSSRGVLPRERLFHSMERAREKKIVWISGPAGSGKTSLAASFIDSLKIPCLWYQLDEGDADLASFFYYLGLAAKYADLRNRKPLPLLTPEYLLGIPVFAKRFFEQIAARLIGKTHLRSAAGNRTPAIVFDNYQDVPEDSVFQTVINAGLESLPQGVSVIMLSRSEPPPAYARLQATGEMNLLGWDNIRLTVDESNAIAKLKAGKDLPDATLSRLYNTIDGWAAGLVLIMESLRIKNFEYQLPRCIPREEIFAYFATELFDRKSQEDQIFLLETSFFPEMNVRTAEALTGNARAGRIFADLNRKNYFINRYASAAHTFQYHPLFREFLQVKAQETIPPEQLQHVKRRAAQVLEANGRGEDSVSLFCEAGEWCEATRVILTHAPGLISQGRWQTLQGWIHSLPEASREENPWLLFCMGVCLLHACPAGSQDIFARSFERFRNSRDAVGSFLSLSGMFDAVGYRLDTFIEYDRLIPMMNALLQEYPQFPSPEIEARVVNSMLYAIWLRQPHNPDLAYWERRGFSLAGNTPDLEVALRILLALMYNALFSGNLEKVDFILVSFQKRIEASHNAPLAVLLLRTFQANYYWICIDFEKNRKSVEDGLALAEHTGIHIFDIFLLGHGAAGALSTGEIVRAEQYLEKMHSALKMMAPSAWSEGLYHCMMAWYHLLKGHPARSSMHADQGINCCIASGSPQTMAIFRLIKSMIMHDLKDDSSARLHLNEVRKICDSMALYQIEFSALLSEAQIAFDHGDEAGGRDFLSLAMSIGRKNGYANGFFWVNSTMARLCVKALEAGIETDYVLDLIRKRNLIPDESIHHLENWPWPLKIYTLGKFDIARDGEVIRFSGKVQQKPLLLLKALIAFGGRDVKEEHLCDALWPDAEGDLAHRSFETTLYRLRQLIGKDNVVHLKEGRLTLDMRSCWVDAFALEKALDEAEVLMGSLQEQ